MAPTGFDHFCSTLCSFASSALLMTYPDFSYKKGIHPVKLILQLKVTGIKHLEKMNRFPYNSNILFTAESKNNVIE